MENQYKQMEIVKVRIFGRLDHIGRVLRINLLDSKVTVRILDKEETPIIDVKMNQLSKY